MPDLQAAFDELKSEVAGLEKQKTNLVQDIIGLESKKTFLKRAVVELEVSRNLAKTKYDNKINTLTEDLDAVEGSIDEHKIDLKLLLGKIEIAKSELKALQEKTASEVIELAKQLNAKKGEIIEVESMKDKALEELNGVAKQIVAERDKLDKLGDLVKQATVDSDSEIALMNQNVIATKAKLKQINKKIDAKVEQYDDLVEAVAKEQTKLEGLAKQQSDFLEYEKRVKKALKAREGALLEGETTLAIAKRRTGSVLDNVR